MDPRPVEIQELEEFMGGAYGRIPRIADNNLMNRLLLIQDIRFNTLFMGLQTAFSNSSYDTGWYDDRTHTFYRPKANGTNSLFLEFANYHEFMHGYSAQKNPAIPQLSRSLEEDFNILLEGGQLYHNREGIIRSFLARCVDEGIADYVAIGVQKEKVRKGRNPGTVYCFTREKMLAEGLLEGIWATEPTPLSPAIARTLRVRGENAVDHFLSAQGTRNRFQRMKKLSEGYEVLQYNAYLLGHYLVRSVCDRKVLKHYYLDNLIQNLPETLYELQDTVLHNI